MIRKLLLSAAALAALLPAAAGAAWYQASSQHFVVYSNDNPERLKAYTQKLERFDKAISVWHVAPEVKRGPASRVTIYVLDDVAAVQKLYGRSGPAGFYEARGSGPVAFMPRNGGDGDLSAQAILFHEYTHHWMFSNWSDAAFPYWFVEGFAELHATAIVRPDGGIVFGANPAYRKYTVGDTNLMPVPDLIRAKPSDNLDGRERDAIYSRGWLLIDYLTFNPERRKQFGEYIGAINAGKSPDEAGRLLGNMNSLDVKLNAWGRQPKLPAAGFSPSELPIGEVTLRALGPGEAALMPAVMISKRGVDAKRAAEVVVMARRLAAPFPDDAAAQNELAEAEFDNASSQKDDAAAIAGFQRAAAAADRAIAADPKSIHALLYRGMADEQILLKQKATDPARWAAVRKWFLAANKIDPEDPEPLVQFYDSFDLAGQKASANAQGGLLYAYALAPYDVGLRMKATHVLLEQNKLKLARIAIAPVAYNAESAGAGAVAVRVLAAIDTGDAAGALALLDRKPDEKPEGGKPPRKPS